jgi:aspartate dehydrogenase
MKKRIGIIGLGTIGSYLLQRIENEESMEVDFVFDVDKSRTKSLAPEIVLDSLDDFAKRRFDLIVEAALPRVVREFGIRIVQRSDFLTLSLTSLADDAFRRQMESSAKASGHRIFVPHGAILGIDGIHDGREVLDRVQITTIKSPKSLGLKNGAKEPAVVYEGSTRGACERFPRNVNVHACLALAGVGFDNTQSRIVADPDTNSMRHVIEAEGRGLHWKLEIESISLGGVTGSYTPESIFQSVRKIFRTDGGICII